MLSEDKLSLAKIRISIAYQRLEAAKSMVMCKDYKAAANRSYYAVFSAMRAMLALIGIDSKKHSGIISEFQKNYIKTGVFDKKLSRIITSLEFVRHNSDYNDFYVISKDEVIKQIENAELFLDAVKEYLINNHNVYPVLEDVDDYIKDNFEG